MLLLKEGVVMKIKFLTGPRAGELSHAPNSQQSQLLAAAGIIEIIPYKSYVERLDFEAREGRDPSNVCVPFVVGIVYELGTLPVSNIPCLFRKHATTVDRIVNVEQAKSVSVPKEWIAKLKTALAAPKQQAEPNSAERSRVQAAMDKSKEAEMNGPVRF